jgi:hypothetical protein
MLAELDGGREWGGIAAAAEGSELEESLDWREIETGYLLFHLVHHFDAGPFAELDFDNVVRLADVARA